MRLKGERWPKSSFGMMRGAMLRNFRDPMPKKVCCASRVFGAKLGKNKVRTFCGRGRAAAIGCHPYPQHATTDQLQVGSYIQNTKHWCGDLWGVRHMKSSQSIRRNRETIWPGHRLSDFQRFLTDMALPVLRQSRLRDLRPWLRQGGAHVGCWTRYAI